MRPIGTIAILIALLVLMWSVQALRIADTHQARGRQTCADLSRESLENLHLGMSLEEVCEVIGSRPTSIDMFRGKVRKNSTGAVVWYKDLAGSYLNLLLRDNAVVMIDWKPSQLRN